MAIWSKLGLSRPAVAAGLALLVLLGAAIFLFFSGSRQGRELSAPEQVTADAPVAQDVASSEPSPDPAPDTQEEIAGDPTVEPPDPTPEPEEQEVATLAPETSAPALLPDPAATPDPQPDPEATTETVKTDPDVSDRDPATPLPAPPTFDVVQVQPDGGGVIAGRAVASRPVKFFLDGVEFAQTRADSAGRFALLLDFPASDAPRALSMASVLEDGTELFSTGTLLISPVVPPVPDPDPEPAPGVVADATPSPDPLPDPAPDSTVDEGPAPQQQDTPAVVLADAAGVSVLQPAPQPSVPDADETAPKVANVVIDTITYDTEGEVALTGRGANSGFVRVYLDGRPVTTTRIAEDGAWQAPLPEIDAGVYTLRVDEVDADGAVTSRVETPFQREEPDVVAAAPTGPQAVTVQPGFTLWAIAEDKFGSGFEYVRVYEANRDLIRDPDLIYPGQVFAIPEG